MSTRTRPDAEQVRRAVAGVADPELPVVTLGMLGMVHDVRVAAGGTVEVELLPTFAGCPATEMMAEDVTAALRTVEGVTDVTVRFRFDPPWSSSHITAEGREALREFGITPPGEVGVEVAVPPGRSPLPLAAVGPPAVCPYCGSTDTGRDSAFGPTPCRSIHFCSTCRQPFEAFKQI